MPIPPIGRFEEMDLNFDGEVTITEWKDFAYDLVSASVQTNLRFGRTLVKKFGKKFGSGSAEL